MFIDLDGNGRKARDHSPPALSSSRQDSEVRLSLDVQGGVLRCGCHMRGWAGGCVRMDKYVARARARTRIRGVFLRCCSDKGLWADQGPLNNEIFFFQHFTEDSPFGPAFLGWQLTAHRWQVILFLLIGFD